MVQRSGRAAGWLQAARLAAAVAAFLFVVSGTPVAAAAEEQGCWACAECHPDENCIWCGSMVAFTVDSCCGNFVDGWGYCVGGHGFAVVCDNGRQCMCNEQGGACESRVPRVND